ncbi:hypothetical protein TNCV_1790271 [Trichonephila clavipes]|nr:hypothetical protein TNCV_1790271 [Trichonephila clavipes]
MSALWIVNGDFFDNSLFHKEISRNLDFVDISSTFRVGKTRPLPGHSSIGSINANNTSSWRASTHHVVQGRRCAGHLNQARRLPGVHPEYNATASGVSLGTLKRGTTSRLTGAGSLLPPVYSEAWAKENADVSPGHQSPPYGRKVGQRERKGSPEHHFPPYGMPHTTNMRVEKPTVLVEKQI